MIIVYKIESKNTGPISSKYTTCSLKGWKLELMIPPNTRRTKIIIMFIYHQDSNLEIKTV